MASSELRLRLRWLGAASVVAAVVWPTAVGARELTFSSLVGVVVMAKPPEPLEELLPQATLIVDAEVSRVVSTQPPRSAAGSAASGGESGSGHLVEAQTVVLKIKQVMKGKLPAEATAKGELVVVKPEASYALRAGNHGPFLLAAQTGGRFVILGRYGPDTYRKEALEKAIRAAGLP